MESSDAITPARQAVNRFLERIERRLRRNRAQDDAVLLMGLILVALLAWRVLRWLDGTAPGAAALTVLIAILSAVGLLWLLARSRLRRRFGMLSVASEADARAGLKDELASAYWFMQAEQSSAWIAAQLQRAAHTAGGLQPEKLVPVPVSGSAAGALIAGVLVLGGVWLAAPLAREDRVAAEAAVLDKADRRQVAALRELVAALPETEAARKLEAALDTLQRAGATREEQQVALEQAKDAVQQIRLDAAATRESLQRLSDALRGEGMEEVAQALAQGDAKAAAELLARIQSQNAPGSRRRGYGQGPSDDGGMESGSQPTLYPATENAHGAQTPGSDASELAATSVDRLKEIAAQLEAANTVNEAWQQVRGPQLAAAQSSALSAGRFSEEAPLTSPPIPSPSDGDAPMTGGAMFRAAAVAHGDGRNEQEGGSRTGEAEGDAPPDALLGASGERLEVQLKRQGVSGEEEEDPSAEQEWYYAQSKQQNALVASSRVQSRARFAAAEASANDGISIQHRQIVKDYFMDLRKGDR
jgi:hypothetical protein